MDNDYAASIDDELCRIRGELERIAEALERAFPKPEQEETR